MYLRTMNSKWEGVGVGSNDERRRKALRVLVPMQTKASWEKDYSK